MGLFVPLSAPSLNAEKSPAPGPREWSLEEAEALLNSLKGVVSARVVESRRGEIEEIHLLTGGEASPKQSVRNVESALLAHFGIAIDHRKVSVAETTEGPGTEAKVLEHPARLTMEDRILFISHRVETERSHRVRIRVTVEWRGERFEGEASGADLIRARLETTASAAVKSIEAAIAPLLGDGEVALSVDGVKLVSAFDAQFALVAIHAIHGRSVTALAGAAAVEDTADKAVILGTLQATDRWVRGRV